MGGILLICAFVAVYLVIYWAIDIELVGGKTAGFFGLNDSATKTLSVLPEKTKNRFSPTAKRADFSEINDSINDTITDKPVKKNTSIKAPVKAFKTVESMKIDLPTDRIITKNTLNNHQKKLHKKNDKDI
jgi:hypothetical protein